MNIRHQKGMTLLELLVATAILAIISGMAFMSLNNLASSKQTLDEINKNLNQENLTYYLLQNDLQMSIASQQFNTVLKQSEFIANSQSFTILKYKTPIAPINQTGNQNRNNYHNNPLTRVRWYVRNKTLYRATQSAAAPLSNNNIWQERPMIEVDLFNCVYQNLTGQSQAVWPAEQRQFSQLPQMITCELQNNQGLNHMFKVVPWQQLGFLS